MKDINDDQEFYHLIMDLNLVKFSEVKFDEDPNKQKILIADKCKNLNKLYHDLARFILKPHGLSE